MGWNMPRWLSGFYVSLNDNPSRIRFVSKKMRNIIDIKCFSDVLRKGRLKYSGHVERMQKNYWVISVNVDGTATRNQPRQTWDKIVKSDHSFGPRQRLPKTME